MRIEFEPVAHVYHLDGVRVPSVTQVLQILEDWSGIPPHLLEAARLFGTHVHDAVALDIRGRLDWRTLDVALVPYVEAWRRFKADSGFVILASEAVIGHRLHRYAGKLDLRGILNKRRALLDIKSGQLPRTVGPQTAAYDAGSIDTHGIKSERRYCLQLDPSLSRGYKLHALTDPADWSNFLSALNCWKFKYAN